MGSSRLAVVIFGVASVVAAGGGSYLATRHNAANVAVVPASAAEPPRATESAEATTAVVQAPVSAAAAVPQQPAVAVQPAAQKVERARVATRAEAPARTASPAPIVAAREEATAAPVEPLPLPAPVAPSAVEELPSPSAVETRVADTPQPIEKPRRTFEELVVAADAVIGLQMDGVISSERARVEDRVVARVSRDVRVGSSVAIPAGARALGNVVVVERGGRVRERARVGIRFHTIELNDGSRLTISTDTIYRYGDAPANGSAAKIGGGAVAGAILGAIINGGKGAAIGAATGAGAGTAAVMTGERSAAVFPAGSDVTARILAPVTVSIERE